MVYGYLLIIAIPILGYGFILYCMIRLARNDVPGGSLIATGSVLTLLGQIANGLTLMATVLPNFIHTRSFVFPGLLQIIGFFCLVIGVSKLTTHVLSTEKLGSSAAKGPPLVAVDDPPRDITAVGK